MSSGCEWGGFPHGLQGWYLLPGSQSGYKPKKALKIRDKTPTLAQVYHMLVGTAGGVLISEISAQRRMPHAIIVIK